MVEEGRNHQAIFIPLLESQQNLLLIEYQQVKYFKECNC